MLVSSILLFVAMTARLFLMFVLPAVPPEIQSIIALVVAGVVAVVLHFGLSSRVAGVVGVLLTVFSVLSSEQVSGFIPARFALPVAIVGAVLAGMSERMTGGLSDPAKRRNPDDHV